MWTVVAFCEPRASNAMDVIAAVGDETHKVSGADLYIGKWNQLVGAYARWTAIQDVYLISPSLRRVSQIYIQPMEQSSVIQNQLRRFSPRVNAPLKLDTSEALNVYMETSQYDETTAALVGVWLADAPITPVTGEIYTVKVVSEAVQTFTQAVWKNHELAFTPDLAVGRYAIVGARMYGGSPGLFRFVSREVAERPGGIMLTDQNLYDDEIFHMGQLGIWLEFDSVLPPSLDVLMAKTCVGQAVYGRLDIMKIG